MRTTARQYAQALFGATKDGADPAVLAAHLRTLLQRRRALKLLPRIAVALENLRREEAGITTATITTARSLDAAAMTGQLGKALGAVEVSARVDPALLGGVALRYGDTRFDASVAGALSRLRRALTIAHRSP